MAETHLPGPPKCPLCPRVRRIDRPVCNNHMRRAGQSNLDAYFLRAREAKGKPANSPEVRALGATIQTMLDSCREFDRIREKGFKPYWNVALACWQHPRERVRAILAIRIGDQVSPEWLDSVAAEIVPKLP